MQVRGNFDRVGKDQQRIKKKKLPTLLGNSNLKKGFLSNLMNIFLIFSLRETFYRIAALFIVCSEFEKIYTLTRLNKTYKNHEKMNNASQTCKDESGLPS